MNLVKTVRIGKLEKAVSIFPKLILVATASPCNAKCPHCPCTVKPEIRNTEKFFDHNLFAKLAGEALPFNAHIRLSGYGEPLLHPRLFDMLAENEGRFSLITNGSLFNRNRIHRIIKMNLDAIEVSVDSHKASIYDKIRVGLDFARVHDNIIDLIKERDIQGAKTKIMVSIINQPSRNPDIEGAVDYWEKIVDKVMLRKYVTWGILPSEDCGEIPDEREACPYPWERLMLDPSGYIRLCPYDDQKLIPPLGNLYENSIEEVWHGERMDAIRWGHKENNFKNVELCSKCTDWAYRSWTHNYRSVMDDYKS